MQIVDNTAKTRGFQAMLPMRDGVRLNTFVFLPATGGPAWPVILHRTPYGITAGDATMKPLLLALALIAAAPIATNAQTTEPRSCQRLHEETSKCEIGMRSCDQRVIARLQAQCQRDEKRLRQVPEPRDDGRP